MFQPYLAVVAVVAGAALLQVANGLLGAFLPIRLGLDGVSETLIGLVGTGYGAGFLVGCLVAQRLIRLVGHIRAFAALAAVTSIACLAFLIHADPWTWTALRAITGLCLAGLFVVVEGWLAATTPIGARGRVIAFYLIACKLATIAGQVLLARIETLGPSLLLVASIACSAALVPITLTRGTTPPAPRLVTLGLADLWRLAPAAVVGVLGAGLINGAVPTLTPVFGQGLGLSVGVVVTLLAVMQLGSLGLQWPLGLASDRVDRRLVILLCLLGVILVSVALAFGGIADPVTLVTVFLLWGGFAMSFYGICAAHAADFAEADQMVGVSGGLLLVWASGSAIGPLLAAQVVSALGPRGLFVYTLAVGGAIALFVLYRMTRRAPLPPEARSGFVPLPAHSPAIGQIDPRARDLP
jgi:MFS family permease